MMSRPEKKKCNMMSQYIEFNVMEALNRFSGWM